MSLTDRDHFVGELLAPDIAEMLDAKATATAREAMVSLLPVEIADVLGAMEHRHRVLAFRILPRDSAAEVLALLPEEEQDQLIEELNDAELARIFDEMAPDDRAELFDEMPGNVAAKLLRLLKPEERRQTQVILGYPPESVGRIMTPDYVGIKPDWTVQQALDHVRTNGRDAETISHIYVVDNQHHLVDHIRLPDLLLANPQTTVESLITRQAPFLHARDDREEAVRAMERYDRSSLPVVDRDGILVGIVTFDDVADVAEEETTEDIQKMAGLQALDDAYLNVGVLHLVQKRGGWLALLFVGQFLTASVMAYFEAEMAAAIVLVTFVPLIISSGGNSGSQATSLVIRALAIGEIELSDWGRVLRREIACGLLLGAMLAAIGIARVEAWHLLGWGDYAGFPLRVGLVVAFALLGVVTWGSIVGAMLPFLLRRLGLDPATSSAPFVATLVDVTGLVIYFTTALLLLKGTLL